jgi:hypothetical protein
MEKNRVAPVGHSRTMILMLGLMFLRENVCRWGEVLALLLFLPKNQR